MLLIIDHYDSFIDMIADYCAQLGQDYHILKTDQITAHTLKQIKPSKVIFGPGPGHPRCQELQLARDLVKQLVDKEIPVLGICLGHQLIAEHFAARVEKAQQIAHGVIDTISYAQDELFAQIPLPFKATRYHSLIVNSESLADSPLKLIAWSPRNEVMAIRHPDLPIYGLQFHPESIMTEHGLPILANFFKLATN